MLHCIPVHFNDLADVYCVQSYESTCHKTYQIPDFFCLEKFLLKIDRNTCKIITCTL